MRIIATPPRAQVALVFTMIAGLAGAPAEAAKPTPTPTPTPTPASLYHTIDLVAPAGTTFRSDLANAWNRLSDDGIFLGMVFVNNSCLSPQTNLQAIATYPTANSTTVTSVQGAVLEASSTLNTAPGGMSTGGTYIVGLVASGCDRPSCNGAIWCAPPWAPAAWSRTGTAPWLRDLPMDSCTTIDPTRTGSGVQAVNETGLAVGMCYGSTSVPVYWRRGPTAWSGTKLDLLSNPEGRAVAVNNLGMVAGNLTVTVGSVYHAAVWRCDSDCSLVQLQDYPGAAWNQAKDINELGDVFGNTANPTAAIFWKYLGNGAWSAPELVASPISQAGACNTTTAVLRASGTSGGTPRKTIVWSKVGTPWSATVLHDVDDRPSTLTFDGAYSGVSMNAIGSIAVTGQDCKNSRSCQPWDGVVVPKP